MKGRITSGCQIEKQNRERVSNNMDPYQPRHFPVGNFIFISNKLGVKSANFGHQVNSDI